MRSRIALAGAVLVALSGCRTPEESSDVKAGPPPGAVGLPVLPASDMKVIVSLEDQGAQALYDALNAEETTDQIGGRKALQAEVSIFCSRSGSGGQIPPGAQGIVAPASFSCSANNVVGGGLPPGVQGIPAAPIFVLDGDAARQFYAAFQVQEEIQQGSARKHYKGNADFSCQYSDTDGLRTGYLCQIKGDGSVIPQSKALFALEGDHAKQLYDKLKVTAVTSAGNGVKERRGNTWIKCDKTGFGGQIPPGAQGIVAPATFECRFVEPAQIPEGAQGFPGPGKELAKFKGELARVVYSKLELTESPVQGGALKEYEGEALVRCAFVKVSGKKKFDCVSKTGSAGGPPPGAQGLPNFN